MKSSPIERYETDVLVVGGGLAGLRAAIAAAEAGARVSVASKRKAGHSGNTLVADAAIAVSSAEVCPTDSVERHIEDTLASGKGLCDIRLVGLLAENSEREVLGLARCGVRFVRDERGALRSGRPPGHSVARCVRVESKGLPRHIHGQAILLPLLDHAGRKGVVFLDETPVLSLETQEGVVRGALALAADERSYLYVRTKAVVLAAGGAGRIFASTNNTADIGGDSYALALQCGATLRDMEFPQFYPNWAVQPFRGTVSSMLMGDGAVLRNRLGERFMERYYPEAKDMATRDQMSQAIFREVQQGRGVEGGVYLDASAVDRTLLEVKYRHLWEAMRRLGRDLGKDAVILRPVAHHVTGGVVVDETMESDVRGLFAAGEAVGGTHGANRLGGNALAECVVTGAISGASAATYAYENEMPRPPSDAELQGLVPSPTFGEGGSDVASLRRALGRIMWERCGIVRTGEGLESALVDLTGMRGILSQGNLSRPARPIRYFELSCMLETAEAVVRSALLRKESRGAHCREDFPAQDDANWQGIVFTRKKGRGVVSWFEPLAPSRAT